MPQPAPRHRSFSFSTAALLAGAGLTGVAFAPGAAAQVNSEATLRQAINDASAGDTISIDDGANITLSGGGGGPLVVDKRLTFDGGSGATINGNNIFQIFSVTEDADEVRFENLTLTAGRSNGDNGGNPDAAGEGGGGGGGVGAGGAIFSTGSRIVLDNTNIQSNRAVGGRGEDGSGVSGGSTGGAGGVATNLFNGSGVGASGGDGGDSATDGQDAVGLGGGGGGGGGGQAASSLAPGDGGDGLRGGGDGGDASNDAGGGGGGGAAYGGGVFLADGANLIIVGEGANFNANTVQGGAGGAGASGSEAGGTGDQRGQQIAGAGPVEIELQPAAGEEIVFNTDGIASIQGVLSGDSEQRVTLIVDGPGSVRLLGSGAGSTPIDFDYDQGRFSPNGRAGTGGIGVTDITGNYSQSGDATLDIEFNASNIDVVDIDGDAELGGRVNFIELAGGSALETARRFVTVDGDRSGTFDRVNSVLLDGSNILRARVSYDNSGAFVTFTDQLRIGDELGDNALDNAVAVSATLDDIVDGNRGDSDDEAALLPAIESLLDSDDTDRAVLSQANTTASAAIVAVPNNLLLASSVALARLDQGAAGFTNRRQRLGSRNAERMLAQAVPADEAPVVVIDRSEPIYLDEPTRVDPAVATLPDDAGMFAPLDNGPAVFAQAIGAFSDIEGDDAAPGQDSTTYGVAFGGDWAVEDWNAVLGVFASFSETETGVDGLGDEFTTDAFQIGLYGAKRFNEHLVLNGTGSAAFLDFESERPTDSGTANADADGFAVGATVEALYNLPLGDRFIVSPLVGIETFFVDRDGYTESGAGALNLNVDDASGEYLTSVIGAQLATSVELEALGNLRLSPLVRLGWSHQFLDQEGTTTSAFAVAPGESFTTRSAARDRDALRVAAALEVGPGDSDDWAVFGRYTGDIAGNGDNHSLRAGLRLSF